MEEIERREENHPSIASSPSPPQTEYDASLSKIVCGNVLFGSGAAASAMLVYSRGSEL